MLANPKVGDLMSNTCRRCEKTVSSRLVLRSVAQPRTRLVVPNVMVDECPHCGHMISIVPQSYAQLREAGVAK